MLDNQNAGSSSVLRCNFITSFLIPSYLLVYNVEAEPDLLVINASQRCIPNCVVGT